MDRKNYFELLGLPFDPPESNETKFKRTFDAAFAEWKKRTEDLVNNPSSPEKKAYYSAELAYQNDMLTVMGEKKSRNAEARDLREKKTAQLEQLLDIMLVGQSGTPEVTNAQIRNVHMKLDLSPKTVEDTYKKKGFIVQQKANAVNLNEEFLAPTIFNEIEGNLGRLRALNVPMYPWAPKVFDLYDLACYFNKGSEADAAGYKSKRTPDLYSIMEAGAVQLASDMSGPGHLLADLLHAGSRQVFNSEANRRKYDKSLERAKLKDFFALLKTAPEDFKKDRFFAESCIRTIQRNFPDYNLALALYNHEAGLARDPYEQVEALIHVSCAACKTPAQFRTREEAIQAKCSTCGAPLYVECPKCHNKVPASADRCACGFLISEMQFFEDYLKLAQFALKEMDLGEARRQLDNAKNAYPNHPKIAAIEKQINDESEKYQRPLDELNTLIAGCMFEQAQAQLVKISAKMPQLRLDTQRKLVAEKLDEARNMMPGPSVPANEAANRCVQILRIVKDYSPAKERLSGIKPRPVKDLRTSVSDVPDLACTLSWNASGDSGITYKVVRKKNGIPSQHADGEVLASDLDRLEYKDKTLSPGVSYGYAVFAYRYGVYSDPVVCEVINYSELDKSRLQAAADDGVCRFSWVLPPNCVGVRILRSINTMPGETPNNDAKVVAHSATSSFEDTTVQNDVRYGYRLQCIYQYGSSQRFSHGHTVFLSPEEPPALLKQLSAKVDNRMVTVQWRCDAKAGQTVTVKEIGADAPVVPVGKVLPSSNMNAALGNGKILATANASAQTCQFPIPENTSVNFAVVVTTATRGMMSGILQASSVEKCEIDRAGSRIEGGKLKILLQKWPKTLERIHYIVATKTGSQAPWARMEDARNRTMNSVSVQEYVRDGMILVDPVPKTDLYISVIGQYKMPDGTVVFSDASKLRLSNKPKERITYRLSWGSGGLFSSKAKAKNCRLLVQCAADETPEMKLVYKSDGHIPMRLLDPKVVVLHTIPESETGLENGQYLFEIPDSTWSRVNSRTELRLMISENDMAEFEVFCPDVATLKVP